MIRSCKITKRRRYGWTATRIKLCDLHSFMSHSLYVCQQMDKTRIMIQSDQISDRKLQIMEQKLMAWRDQGRYFSTESSTNCYQAKDFHTVFQIMVYTCSRVATGIRWLWRSALYLESCKSRIDRQSQCIFLLLFCRVCRTPEKGGWFWPY